MQTADGKQMCQAEVGEWPAGPAAGRPPLSEKDSCGHGRLPRRKQVLQSLDEGPPHGLEQPPASHRHRTARRDFPPSRQAARPANGSARQEPPVIESSGKVGGSRGPHFHHPGDHGSRRRRCALPAHHDTLARNDGSDLPGQRAGGWMHQPGRSAPGIIVPHGCPAGDPEDDGTGPGQRDGGRPGVVDQCEASVPTGLGFQRAAQDAAGQDGSPDGYDGPGPSQRQPDRSGRGDAGPQGRIAHPGWQWFRHLAAQAKAGDEDQAPGDGPMADGKAARGKKMSLQLEFAVGRNMRWSPSLLQKWHRFLPRSLER